MGCEASAQRVQAAAYNPSILGRGASLQKSRTQNLSTNPDRVQLLHNTVEVAWGVVATVYTLPSSLKEAIVALPGCRGSHRGTLNFPSRTLKPW